MVEFFSSLSLLNQIALLGLLSLALPIIIHLINPAKGKLVWVGNIDLIKKIQQLKVKQLKLHQWLLLIVRCLILTLLVLLLAKLASNYQGTTSNAGHVYLSPKWVTAVSDKEITRLTGDYPERSFYWLAPGFAPIDIELLTDPRALKSITTTSDAYKEIHSSALIAELKLLRPADLPVQVFITNTDYSNLAPRSETEAHFKISVQAVELNLQNHPLNILLAAAPNRADDTEIVRGALKLLNSDSENRLRITSEMVKSETLLSRENDEASGSDPALKNPMINTLSDEQSAEQNAEQFDVVILLGEMLDSSAFKTRLKANALVLNDANYPLEPGATRLINLEGERVAFYHGVEQGSSAQAMPVWRANTNEVLLDIDRTDRHIELNFNSRFHPQWTSLVELNDFSSLLGEWIDHYRGPILYPVDSAEILQKANQPVKRVTQVWLLDSWLLFALALLWLIERWLAEGRRPDPEPVVSS